jgi:VCBS repeat-containing protein
MMPSSQSKNWLVRNIAVLLVTSMVFVLYPASRASGSNSIFSEDFENGFNQWTMDGLWNPEEQSEDCGDQIAPFPSSTHAAYYGINGQCDYNNGGVNSGFLTLTAPVVMPVSQTGRTATLTFSSYEEAESSSAYDIRRVQVSKDGGASWTTLGQGTVQGTWTLRSYDLTPYLGTNLLLRFYFDSVDASLNGYFGWMVDNISIFTIDPPDAVDDTFTSNEDVALVIPAPGVLNNDSDPNGDSLAVSDYQSISDLRVPVSVNPDGSFSYNPTGVAGMQALDIGESRQDIFTYITSDGNGGADQATVFVTVNGRNDAPVANVDAVSTNEDVPVQILVLSNDTDIEHDPLVIFSSTQGSHGSVQISPGGTSLTYTPSLNYFGTDTFSYIVTDGLLTSSGDVTVTINSLNDPPVFAYIGDKMVSEGTELAFTAEANDPDLPVNTLVYSLDPGAPTGASINATTGAFTWTPDEVEGPGSYTVTVRVTDNVSPDSSDSETITITVDEVNLSPELGPIGNKTISEGELLSFTATATDADLPPNSLVFTLDPGAPAGAGIDPGTGQFNWTPSEDQGPGTYPITVLVRDDGTPNLSDTRTFTVTVNEANSAPVLDLIGNKIIDEGLALNFTATVSDLDLPANNLAFSLIGAPSGASINAQPVCLTDTQKTRDPKTTRSQCECRTGFSWKTRDNHHQHP